MPRSTQRVVAAAGIVLVGAGAGFLLLVSAAYEAGVFENTEPSERPFEVVAALAVGGLVTAVVGLCALVAGSRAWTRRAAIAQAACAVLAGLLLEAMSRDRLDPLLAAGLIATVAVDAVAVWATNVSCEEPAAARWTRAAGRMAPGIPRRASLAAMLAIAATGALAVVVEQALGGPFNLRLAGGAGPARRAGRRGGGSARGRLARRRRGRCPASGRYGRAPAPVLGLSTVVCVRQLRKGGRGVKPLPRRRARRGRRAPVGRPAAGAGGAA